MIAEAMEETTGRSARVTEGLDEHVGTRLGTVAGSPVIRLDELDAVIFDMDGVVTDTASVHAAAWKRLFDAFLEARGRETHERVASFDGDSDYRRYVDGKPRSDGVRDFLASRGIVLPEGDVDDPPGAETVHGLGERKDGYFLAQIREHGVTPYAGTVELVRSLRRSGVRVAVVSASRNMDHVLEAAGVAGLFEARIDGAESQRLGLRGKPDPAIFLEAARRLGVVPGRAAVIEDALAGVEAGRHGGFGLVVGVDRSGHPDELRARGADIVVTDLAELVATIRPTPAMRAGVPEPTADPAWLVEVVGHDGLRERDVESWFAVGNGRTGTRGSLDEAGPDSTPATYVAGVYGGREAGRRLVPGPEWTRLAPRVGDERMDLRRGTTLEHRRILDLRQAILFRSWRQQLPSGVGIRFHSARFASLADRDVLILLADASADGHRVQLADGMPLPAEDGVVERVLELPAADRKTVGVRGRRGGATAYAFVTEEHEGRLSRLVGVARTPVAAPDAAVQPVPHVQATRCLERARAAGVAKLLDRHRAAWEARWHDADIGIDGDAAAQRALRFALYHLIAAADPESDMASVGARGLTGPGYAGHVFWDTDVFVLPFYIHTDPRTARALVAYRHRTLPAARARAAEMGYRGALFAWESADTGEDVTPREAVGTDGRRIPILTGLQEHHVSADVAWAAWRYWQATADAAFLTEIGAEIILETARFWASRVRRGRDGRHHISAVIGPDEYHVAVRDNAFTNVMARWNLKQGVEVARLVSESDPTIWRALARRIELRPAELRRWAAVAESLVDGFDPETLLYEQFQGFFDLEDVRVADLSPRPVAADVLLGEERVRRAQIVKQADVLMIFHMLPDLVPLRVAGANYRYYEPRTAHGSSLCPAIHAAIAARLGRLDEALDYFRMAGAVDLGNAMGNASQGVHIASMGALWQAAASFAGVRASGPALRVHPRLPSAWHRLSIPILWRGARLEMIIEQDSVTVTLDRTAVLALGGGAGRSLHAGQYTARRVQGRWRDFEVAR